MKFTAALICLAISGTAAFTTSTTTTQSTAVYSSLNGWEPNEKKFAAGLPGAVAPFGKGFDPFGIADRESFATIKTFRESEVTHGRVAMLAGTFTMSMIPL